MILKDLLIINKLGLHARAAAKFVKTANRFVSDTYVERNGQRVNAKSIMGIMLLSASKGTTIKVMANGEDENEALAALQDLVANRFGEPE